MLSVKLSLIALLSVGLVLSVQTPRIQARQGFPGVRTCPKGQVWERPHVKPDGKIAPGFCRPANRADFRWVPGKKGPDGKWHRGHWVPAGPTPPNKAWVPGHYDKKGKWVEGHYRTKRRPPPAGGVFGPRSPGRTGGKKPPLPFIK
ncbi:MAG: hypothetical protein JRG73_09235 [Deltaproteobacteria bacterium]|nr:hypothetical protein [Deltaproteobacteria bacterium]MBW2307105.1 hypothetical protein [Deltaproteobacteria bacterium]